MIDDVIWAKNAPTPITTNLRWHKTRKKDSVGIVDPFSVLPTDHIIIGVRQTQTADWQINEGNIVVESSNRFRKGLC